jgi:hypothetical protein
MASKMGNWVAYQQRHLSDADFAAWVASDLKVQSFLDKQNRIPAVVRALDDLSKDIGKKVMVPALQKASEFLAQIEKSAAPSDAGTLKQSIGSNKAKYYPATFCGYVASGPRRGYARAVMPIQNKRGATRLKRMSKKFTQTTPTTLQIKNPVAYARFVMKGRHAIFRPKTAKAFPMLISGGTFFSRRVKEAAPRDFMAPAEGQVDQAAGIATQEMNAKLATLLKD